MQQHLHLHIVTGMVAEGGLARLTLTDRLRGWLMHRGHQAAAAAEQAGAAAPLAEAGGLARQPGQRRPPGLPPSAAAGAPGIAVRAVGTSPESPRAAREFTRDTLQRWDIYAAFQDTATVVSELVTNALFHGIRAACQAGRGPGDPGGQVELTLWHRASHLVCAVTDPSPDPPLLQSPDPGAEAGRGLQVVQALTASWGWAMLGFHRKVVWAALRVPPARLPARLPAASGPRRRPPRGPRLAGPPGHGHGRITCPAGPVRYYLSRTGTSPHGLTTGAVPAGHS